MPAEPNQPEPENVDPDLLSTPAGVAGDLEEEALETGATTDGEELAPDGSDAARSR
jgi:hypothetical protein